MAWCIRGSSLGRRGTATMDHPRRRGAGRAGLHVRWGCGFPHPRAAMRSGGPRRIDAMCGRFTETKVDPGLVAARFGVLESAVPGDTLGRFNVCPTEPVLAVDAERAPRALRWGLIPPWARALRAGPEPINARAESLRDKRLFAPLIATAEHRCLVVADGWYEWLRPEAPKGQRVPFRYTVDGGELFAFAGLWHEGRIGSERIASVTLLTTTANAVCAPV